MTRVFPFSKLAARMRNLERHVSETAIDRIVKNAATEFGSKVVDATRVDTGKARSNWRASLGRAISGAARKPYAPGEKLGIGETANRQAVKNQQRANIQLFRAKLHRSIFFTNRTPYIETLDRGGPRNSADRMVDKGLQAARVVANITPILKGL